MLKVTKIQKCPPKSGIVESDFSPGSEPETIELNSNEVKNIPLGSDSTGKRLRSVPQCTEKGEPAAPKRWSKWTKTGEIIQSPSKTLKKNRLKEITVDQKSEIFDKNVPNNSLEVEKHAIKNSPLFTVILEPKFTDDSQRHLSPQLVTKAGDSRISELKESHDMKVKPIQENITEKK